MADQGTIQTELEGFAMARQEYISIADFAKRAGVSKQAIYKQVGNTNSKLSPYVRQDGRRTLIDSSALFALYEVELDVSTLSTNKVEMTTKKSTSRVEEPTIESTTINQETTDSTQENQPLSTDYIEFLKSEIAGIKAERAELEKRLNATIQEKDSIIKQQSEQLSNLAQQVAQIANKALITTSQQQYLTAAEKIDRTDTTTNQEGSAQENQKKGFFRRLFGC